MKTLLKFEGKMPSFSSNRKWCVLTTINGDNLDVTAFSNNGKIIKGSAKVKMDDYINKPRCIINKNDEIFVVGGHPAPFRHTIHIYKFKIINNEVCAIKYIDIPVERGFCEIGRPQIAVHQNNVCLSYLHHNDDKSEKNKPYIFEVILHQFNFELEEKSRQVIKSGNEEWRDTSVYGDALHLIVSYKKAGSYGILYDVINRKEYPIKKIDGENTVSYGETFILGKKLYHAYCSYNSESIILHEKLLPTFTAIEDSVVINNCRCDGTEIDPFPSLEVDDDGQVICCAVKNKGSIVEISSLLKVIKTIVIAPIPHVHCDICMFDDKLYAAIQTSTYNIELVDMEYACNKPYIGVSDVVVVDEEVVPENNEEKKEDTVGTIYDILNLIKKIYTFFKKRKK